MHHFINASGIRKSQKELRDYSLRVGVGLGLAGLRVGGLRTRGERGKRNGFAHCAHVLALAFERLLFISVYYY